MDHVVFGGPIERDVGGGQNQICATWYNAAVSQHKLGVASDWVRA